MASLPNIRANLNVPFPARILGAGPMSITKANGVWTVALDYTLLATHTPPVDQYPVTYIGTYNSATGLYEKMTLTDMQAAAQAGLPCAIEASFDAGGQPLQPGLSPFIEIPFNMTISSAVTMLDKNGSVVIEPWVCTKADFNPPTLPTTANKISAAAPMTVAAGVLANDTTLTGWTTALSAGDILAFNINSALLATKVTASLKGTRNA